MLEKMKDISSNLLYPSQDTTRLNGNFAQIMGVKKYGRLCTYGLGITSIDIYGDVPSHKTCYCMVIEYKE